MKTNLKMKTRLIKTKIISGRWLTLLALMLASLSVGAQTVVWSDDFDDGLGDNRWFADQGLWQMGSPTAGPPTNAVGKRAFSGANCATTGLTGNYLANQNTRLIRIASFIVPAADQNPRLRFWHWYWIWEGDEAKVEIKPVGSSTWTVISPTYSTRESAVWTRPSLNLSQFAGQTVQVAFHFTSDGGTENVGWYVDDIALVTGTPVFNNPEGFEGGLGDWQADRGTWQVGVPTSGPGAAYAGTNCAATVLAGNYPDFVDSRFISAPLTLPPASASPAVRFRHWFRIVDGDQGVVEIKATNTNTWTPLATYTGVSSGWTYPFLDLSTFGGKTVQIAFHFTSDGGSRDAGWYVDELNLLNYVSPPVITQSPTNQTVIVGSNATFNVTVSGTAPFNYQWRFGGVNLNNETNQLLNLINVQTNQAGNYDVIVANSSQTVTSQPPALLTVLVPVSLTGLTMQPSSPVLEGTNVTFCVTATGTAPLTCMSHQKVWARGN